MAPNETGAQVPGHRESGVKVREIKPYKGDICIAGISGRFPESDCVGEFEHNLLNKINMLTTDSRRWEPWHMGIPPVNGKLKNIDKFDAEFFGVNMKQAHYIDPQQRLLMEVVYEALIDAGEDIESLRGSRTGVYVGCTCAEAEAAWMQCQSPYAMQGVAHACMPNRVSHFFDWKGPSCNYDTACSSSIVCLEAAETHIRTGVIDAAIVASCNLVMRPSTSWAFQHMSMLSSSGCKAFDAAGDGFIRSECVSAVWLRKKDDAKRIYSTVLGTMTNQDGYTSNGLLYPNTLAQEELMRDLYTHFKINPHEVKYFECHGTGTPAGDPNELRAIRSVICENRKDPLMIGSTKTNMGHGEIASGMCSLAKMTIAMQTRLIPPNLHFNNPNPKIPGLLDGTFKVVTEPTPWKGGLMAVNSFGMSGSNGHSVLKSYDTRLATPHPASKKPRLFVYSARTEEGMKAILEEAHKYPDNPEFQALAQVSACGNLGSMPYRGATILNARQEYREVQKNFSKQREVWFIFAGMGSQWIGMGRCMMALDVFRQSVEETASYIKPLGIDLMKILLNGTEDDLKPATNPFVCICAVQIGLTDVLFAMGIKPDGIVGHSLGEVAAGYADGALTKKETIMAAYYRGRIMIDNPPPKGKMAAVGLTWEEAKQQVPQGVVAACHNAYDSVTISGAAPEMDKFMDELASRGVFVKEVNSNNIAYHSHFMKALSGNLKSALTKIIEPKPRTSRWKCTSIPEERWNTPLAKYADASFQANNLESPVLFYEALQKIPKTAIAIEVAPIGLLQSVIKKTVGPEAISVGLQKRKHDNNLEFFFAALGKCFANGLDLDPTKVYPPVKFPVSNGTPMLSNMISAQWDHSTEWTVPSVEDFEGKGKASSGNSFEIDAVVGGEDEYLRDHALDGRPLFPATGSLVLAWKALATMKGLDFDKMPVRLTDVKIHQAMFLRDSGVSKIEVSIMPGTGQFQSFEGDTLISSGYITAMDDSPLETGQHLKKAFRARLDWYPRTQVLDKTEVYREFILRGYEYGPYFQGITRASIDGIAADIRFDGRWISYLDTVLQMVVLARPGDFQLMPVELEMVNIDPTVHPVAPAEGEEAPMTAASYDPVLDIVAAGGVELKGTRTIMANRRLTHPPAVLDDFGFIPYTEALEDDRSAPATTPALKAYADACTELSRQGMIRMLAKNRDILPNVEFVEKCLEYTNKTLSQTVRTSSYEEALEAIDNLIQHNDELSTHNPTLHKLNQILYEEQMTKDNQHELRSMFHKNRLLVFDDTLSAVLETPEIVKHCIDTVAENGHSNVIDILELQSRKSVYFRKAFPHALDYFTFRDYKYTVADLIGTEDAEDYPAKQVKFNPTQPDKFPANLDGTQDLVVLKNVLHFYDDMDEAMRAIGRMLKPGGFLLVTEIVERFGMSCPVENFLAPEMGGKGGPEGDRILGCYYTDAQWRAFFDRHGYEEVIYRNDDISSSVFLLKQRLQLATPPTVVAVDDLECSWLEKVKAEYAKVKAGPDDGRLWLVATEELSGLRGFFACIKWEQDSQRVRYAQVLNLKKGSSVPHLTADSAEFKALAMKDLTYNVYRDGRWGGFRGLPILDGMRQKARSTQRVYADWMSPSDIGSLRWFDSPIKPNTQNGKTPSLETCSVYYAGLSQRDVLLATGSLRRDELPKGMFYNESPLGIEFSGRDSSGKRVMGLCPPPAMTTSILCPRSSLWSVPDQWSLEEAATTPQAYGTAYYALVCNAQISKEDIVFVQTGWTDVGQAAIAVAASYGCEVHTLSRNKEETAVLKANFSHLKDRNIHNANDTSFLRQILVETSGKGATIVLGCVGGDILPASLKLLSKQGRYLDISPVGNMEAQEKFSTIAKKGSNFMKVNLDSVIDAQNHQWTELYDLLKSGISSGVVKPLRRNVFGMTKLVEAFKSAEEGSSSDKILVQLRGEERQNVVSPSSTTFSGIARAHFYSHKSYILIGGLGGLGMELADWMVTKGARKIVLTSRSGVKDGYQTRKIAYLKSLGAEVEVACFSVNTLKSADTLVDLASNLGPIGGIFNLGLVLADSNIENMTLEMFKAALETKVTTTTLLDKITRERAAVRSSLDYFVMFSSVTSSDGHLGQSNYAFGNSVMERICEKRKFEGLPAFVVQWGPVADAGFVGVASNTRLITGKFPQRMFNAKACFDYMISQEDATIITSFIIPEKAQAEAGGEESLAQQVARGVAKVLGIKDLSGTDPDKEFLDMGMDSLMSVEIKQLLEREAEVVVSTKDVQIMSFNALKGLIDG